VADLVPGQRMKAATVLALEVARQASILDKTSNPMAVGERKTIFMVQYPDCRFQGTADRIPNDRG
jgi:hypothetical protein